MTFEVIFVLFNTIFSMLTSRYTSFQSLIGILIDCDHIAPSGDRTKAVEDKFQSLIGILVDSQPLFKQPLIVCKYLPS